MKNYKPLLIREISIKTAKEWLQQAAELIATIQNHDHLYFKN
jgi:hypothetical protein